MPGIWSGQKLWAARSLRMRWDYSLLIYFLLDIVKTCRCPSRYYLIMIAASSYRKIPQKDFFSRWSNNPKDKKLEESSGAEGEEGEISERFFRNKVALVWPAKYREKWLETHLWRVSSLKIDILMAFLQSSADAMPHRLLSKSIS